MKGEMMCKDIDAELSTGGTTHRKAGFPSPGAESGPTPVDGPFPTSAPLGTMDHKDTTSESAPDQRCWSTGPGPRRPKGHDRLMDKIQAAADTAPAICPVCGEWPAASATRRDGDLAVADYRDASGHIWTTKWLVPA